MEMNKENQDQQMLARKVGLINPSTPRTPFAQVNRQPVSQVTRALKDGQRETKRHSWAPDSLRGQFLKKKEQRKSEAGCGKALPEAPESTEQISLTCSLPSSPLLKLPQSDSAQDVHPDVSHSCPEMLSSDLPLPPICETPPTKQQVLATSIQLSKDGSPSSSEIDLSMRCEEATPLSNPISCESESEVDVSSDVQEGSILSEYSSESSSPESSCIGLVTENCIVSETESPAKLPCTCTGKGDMSSCTQTDMPTVECEKKSDSVAIVHSILEGVLSAVGGNSHSEDSEFKTRINQTVTSNSQAAIMCKPNTFLSEYAKFVDSYTPGDSPGLPLSSSSLTDVTPFSQNSRNMEKTNDCSSEGEVMTVDFLTSLVSDSDDSFASAVSVQRQLVFENKDTGSPESSPDESIGFVRSSESRLDLRENSSSESMRNHSRESSPDNDFLNLSISDQKVEFIALPSKLKSVGSSPIVAPCKDQECSPISWSNPASSSSSESCVTSSPPMPTLSQGVQTMRMNTATQSSPAATETVQTPENPIKSKVLDIVSIAVSPFPVSVRESKTNTSVTEMSDANTMACVLTSEVALSPVPVSVREIDTMTTVTKTTEAGMTTDGAECQDHSMLATAEMDSKMTMTDGTGHRSVCTTMTPLKAMAKQGKRLTSDDIRKQHPRALANQLETLTVSNTRLDDEVRSLQLEQKRLQVALKQARNEATSKQGELVAAEKQKTEEWREKARQQENKCSGLEQQSTEQQSRVIALEQELCNLRRTSETDQQKQAEELLSLQDRCRTLEEQSAVVTQQYEQQIDELRTSLDTNSYKRQFERAQQMLREREAELGEIRGLFSDLQTTADKQEKVHLAYQEVRDKILAVAKENCSLKEALQERACLSKLEAEQQKVKLQSLQQQHASVTEELSSLKNTMAINNANLAELEKLYCTSSSDLLTATGRVVELNSELFEAKKALQEATLSKEMEAKESSDAKEEMLVMCESYRTLSTALQHAQAQLQQQEFEYQNLQDLSQQMKTIYEEKFENMTLGVENLQRTLDNREVDIDHLEKELYQCRNVIVEQRQKMDDMQRQLTEAQAIAAEKREEEEGIEFFKQSNAFLEAERAVYVQSLRDLEDKMKVMAQENQQQRQTAADMTQLLEEVQEDKLRLISELSGMQFQYVNASRALKVAEDECSRVESVAMAAASDLLQQMQGVLAELKKKTGLEAVPGPSVPTVHSQRLPPKSRPVKSKRHSRKSFVSKILGAALDEDEDDKMETGSYLGDGEVVNVPDVTAVGKVRTSVVKQSVMEPRLSLSFTDGISPTRTGRKKLDFSSQPLSVSMFESSGVRDGVPVSSAFKPIHASSHSLPGHPRRSLLLPNSSPSQPPSSAVAKIRSIPKTQRRSEQIMSSTSPAAKSRNGCEAREEEGENKLVSCLVALKEVFSDIVRLVSIVDRATQLSLQDLQEENNMLRERTDILEERTERNNAQLNVSRQEMVAKDNTIAQLQQQSREMTERMMAITDQKFEVKRLKGELKRLEAQLIQERGEKEVVSSELDAILRRLETSSSSKDGGATQARCTRDIISLKKKNQQLQAKLEEQRDHYEELGSKAARRMRVLDDNWKKAEDEVYRLDDLVESIRQIAEHDSSSLSTSPSTDLQSIRRIIRGDSNPSQH